MRPRQERAALKAVEEARRDLEAIERNLNLIFARDEWPVETAVGQKRPLDPQHDNVRHVYRNVLAISAALFKTRQTVKNIVSEVPEGITRESTIVDCSVCSQPADPPRHGMCEACNRAFLRSDIADIGTWKAQRLHFLSRKRKSKST